MSYILEALKKAEQKRSRGELPDLQSVTGAPSNPSPKSGGMVWKRLLVLALFGNILIFTCYLVFIANKPSPQVQTDSIGASTREGEIGDEKGKADDDVPSMAKLRPPAVGARNPEKGEVRGEERKVREKLKLPSVAMEKPPVVAPAADKVNLFGKLPQAVQAGIPKMTMTLHFYVSDAAARMVRINGRNLREGDGLNKGVKIAEITPQGVVFESAGYRFEVPGLMVARR